MQKDRFLELWKEGKGDQEIAKVAGCSVATVCRWRKQQQISPNVTRGKMDSPIQAEILRLIESGLPLQEVSRQTGVFVETIRKLANRRGIVYMKSQRRTQSKEVHGTLGYGGYVELRVDVDGPYGNLVHHGGKLTGYAPLHRMRMQGKLGRELLPGEIVHHVDGDIYNNSLPNLELFHSTGEHLKHHRETNVRRCKESADRW